MVVLGGTITLSIVEKVIIQTSLIKGLADRGYRIENYKPLTKKDFLMLVPVLNILSGIRKIRHVYKTLGESNEQLLADLQFIPFTQQERERYSSNPTIRNAFKMNLKVQIIPTGFMSYVENGCINEILFAKEQERLIIISVKGEIASLSRQERYQKVKIEMSEINSHAISNIPVYAEKVALKEKSQQYQVTFPSEALDKPKVYVKVINKD